MIYSDESIEKLIELITHRLNNNYNRILRNSPNEIINGYNFYDLYRRVQEHNIPTTNNNSKENFQSKWKLNINDLVFVKNQEKGKLAQRYTGPYRILTIGKKGCWIKIMNEKDWIHIKNVKVWKGAECGMSDR